MLLCPQHLVDRITAGGHATVGALGVVTAPGASTSYCGHEPAWADLAAGPSQAPKLWTEWLARYCAPIYFFSELI
jgi:hypothetical protein